MMDPRHWPRVWRLFITNSFYQALAMGLLASLCSSSLWALAPVTFAALDWTLYDTWLRIRPPIAVSERLTILVLDPASEDRFGPTLDRAVLAQLITTVHEAGAAAIGIDVRLDRASPASLGGAASDALLIEALQAAGSVAVIHTAQTAFPTSATASGHVTLSVQPDRIGRQVPLLAVVDGQAVPAFGALVYDLFRQQSERPGQRLLSDQPSIQTLNPVGNGSLAALATTPIASVWESMQLNDRRRLEDWFNGKIVVILPAAVDEGTWLLPTGQSVAGIVPHLHLLNSLLTGNTVVVTGRGTAFGLTLVLASAIAWGLLRSKGLLGLALAAAVMIFYAATSVALLWILHLVLPLPLPLTAASVVVVCSLAWTHLTALPRMMLLEQDMLRVRQDAAAIREALTLRENRAEALEEDLEAAKAAVAQSAAQREALAQDTAFLQAQIAEVRAQEHVARQQLEQVERQLDDLRAATTDMRPLADAECQRLQDECRAVGIMTQDPTLLKMFRDLKKAAASPLTVLLLGEPGTGKELFARAVHRLSQRAGGAFVPVNMAAIPGELFESELFGHVKGSYTGATAERRGYFEISHRGTIFMDEIGDLRLDHQSKLLRVLQDQSFYRVGATAPTAVDVRIVAATNRDLQRGVSEGWFREDLYFRLTGFVFRLPPLRERSGDIAVIADAALEEIARRMRKTRPRLSNDALKLLTAHRWPGNVRELRNVLERAVALGDGELLSRDAFSLDVTSRSDDDQREKHAACPDTASDKAVLDCLRRQGFDMQATAVILGWDRSTVTQRLKGLCFEALVEHHGDQAKAALAIAGDPCHLRTVELKLRDYYKHLLTVVGPFPDADRAIADCRRRFKNLPERHFVSVVRLVRTHFEGALSRRPIPTAMTET